MCIRDRSEHLSLLSVRQHINLLDRFADNQDLLNEYKDFYRIYKETQKELTELRQAQLDAARMSDLLNYQIQEIEAANLRAGEEEDLREELNRLSNAEKLSSLAKQAYSLLEEETTESQSISTMLGEVIGAIRGLAAIDNSLEILTDQSENVLNLVSDISRDLQHYPVSYTHLTLPTILRV